MKIGILTHHYINNFGAYLQAYALCKTIKRLYPQDEVFIIHYINIKHFLINTCGWFRYYRGKESFRAWREKVKLPATFARERRRHLPLTRKCFSARAVNRLGLDCIVVGSDEVWNYQDKKGNAKIKFAWGLTCRNIIAYAPSVGNSVVSGEMPPYIREGLKRFQAFSARDTLTETFIKELTGKEAARVLDPTFLTEFPKEFPQGIRRPYILFYYCDKLPGEILEEIVSYAKEKGYAIYGAGEYNKIYSGLTVNLTPFQWIGMFREAEFVFTGTFHGTVFSLLNRKQFACFLSNKSRKEKVGALLKGFGMQDRIMGKKEDLPALLERKIDYIKVSQEIDRQKKAGISYLKRSIGTESGQ